MSATSVPVECMFSTTGIISNGKRSSIGPAKLNRILFTIILHSLPLTTDKPMALTVCLSAFYVCLKHLWGRVVGLQTVSSHENLRSNDSRWLYDPIRYDTRCYFNVRSKADMNRLNLPHGDDN